MNSRPTLKELLLSGPFLDEGIPLVDRRGDAEREAQRHRELEVAFSESGESESD